VRVSEGAVRPGKVVADARERVLRSYRRRWDEAYTQTDCAGWAYVSHESGRSQRAETLCPVEKATCAAPLCEAVTLCRGYKDPISHEAETMASEPGGLMLARGASPVRGSAGKLQSGIGTVDEGGASRTG